jgi:hypothetical protein
MNNIVINYKIVKDINISKFKDIINGCLSNRYKVFLNIYDFSLSKQAENYLQEIKDIDLSNINISVLNYDYEDFSNADNMILNNLIRHGDSIAFGIFPENLIFDSESMNRLDLDLLKNEINGLIYFDYIINNIRCFLRSRVMNIKLNVPAVFWSTSKLIRHISEQDKLNIVANNFAAIHIPNSFCKIFTDDK